MSDNQISRNVRFLLWKRDVPRTQWTSWLESKLDWAPTQVAELVHDHLEDARIDARAVDELTALFELDPTDDDIRFRDLSADHGGVLHENLHYLLDSLERGGKTVLAKTLGVVPTTISRWLNGTSRPSKSTLRELVIYFGLPISTDLESDPLYLSVEPVAQSEQRRWLRQQLEELSTEDFKQLYPALRRMLRDK